METQKKRRGDRKDGRLMRELDSLHYVTGILYPNRCDNEAYISQRIDLTNMNAYIAKKNETETEFPYTMFHLVLAALMKTITLRPKLNRFIVNSNFYQRNEVSASFVVKKQFSDKGAEALAFLHCKDEYTLSDIHDYIRRQGFVEPLSAKFCNGTTSTCDGLSQWGSQEMAQTGYNSMEILRHYYGDDIELVVNAPIQDITQSYPGSPLRLGSVGEEVAVVQTSLNRISQNYPAIPKIQPVTGIFGEDTEYSVRQFQRIFNLASDGVVGKATWYKLVYLYVGVTRLSELVSEGQTFYKVQFQYPGVLREGDTGTEVQVLQYMLAVLAEFDEVIPPLTVDGVFGPSTANAVQSFQRQTDLLPDGVVGEATWDALYREFASLEAVLQQDVARFPFQASELIPSLVDLTLAAVSGHSETPRFGQHPGTDLRLGQSDQQEVSLS